MSEVVSFCLGLASNCIIPFTVYNSSLTDTYSTVWRMLGIFKVQQRLSPFGEVSDR